MMGVLYVGKRFQWKHF